MRFLYVTLVTVGSGALLTSPVAAQGCGNDCTSLVLHAVDSGLAACDVPNCVTEIPNVDVAGFASPAIVLAVYNYDDVGGLQCAFEFDPSWVFTSASWDCQPNQMSVVTPAPPFGETDGTLATVFDAVVGGAVAPVGRMHFASAASGCLVIVDSAYPNGTHVVDTPGTTPTWIVPEMRGRVCVGEGGWHGCEFAAVAAATWGQVKAQYGAN